MNALLTELASLSIYINITEDTAVKKIIKLLKLLRDGADSAEEAIRAYSEVHAALLSENCRSLYRHIEDITLRDENIFTLSCEKGTIDADDPLAKQAMVELGILKKLAYQLC